MANKGSPCDRLVTDVKSIHSFLCAQSRVVDIANALTTQRLSICSRISNLDHLDMSGGTVLTDTLVAGPWTSDQKASLLQAIRDRLDGTTIGGRQPYKPRRKNQTLTTFEQYLTDEDITYLSDEHVCDYGGNLYVMWFIVCLFCVVVNAVVIDT